MAQVTTTETLPFDRRQIYRPFLERLNPIALNRSVAQRNLLVVPPKSDPRDPKQPPIYEVFADAAELNRGTQMALVGGIGSGKTTELLLTMDRLKRHDDAVNVFLEAAEFTDFSETNPGAMLAAIGLRLFARISKRFGEPSGQVQLARVKLRKLALGTTEWHNGPPYCEDGDESVPMHVPGLMRPRFPELKERVAEVKDLLGTVLLPFLEHDSQITVIVDGLDRLIEPTRFREFAEQDLRAVRGMQVTIIVAVPLLLWYDNSRFLQDYFDIVRHIPAAAIDPKESGFLKAILKRRGADKLMSAAAMSDICRFSGGVLRDLLELAQSAAQYAYRDAEDRIGKQHVRAAVRQLGNRYLAGVGTTRLRLIRRLLRDDQFSPNNSDSKDLLVSRQVLEYSNGGRDYFLVHPALVEVLPREGAMTFSVVTPFRLVRALGVAGARNPAIYLLICDGPVAATVEADIVAETAVQLSTAIHVSTASQVLHNNLPTWHDGSIRLIHFDAWLPDLVEALDRHSALLVQDGGQLLLLVDQRSAERILSRAPNLRSRLTDVFQIGPDDLSGGLPT